MKPFSPTRLGCALLVAFASLAPAQAFAPARGHFWLSAALPGVIKGSASHTGKGSLILNNNSTSKVYHRAGASGCSSRNQILPGNRVVIHADSLKSAKAFAEAQGFTPCKVCF